jgi:hypothetical protein
MRPHLPELTESLHAEHLILEEQIERLKRDLDTAGQEASATARSRLGLELYRSYSAFLAEYFRHLDREEASLPQQWSALSPEELSAVMTRFRASRTPEQALTDVELMIPALSPDERELLLFGARASAPAEAFAAMLDRAKSLLTAPELARLAAVAGMETKIP